MSESSGSLFPLFLLGSPTSVYVRNPVPTRVTQETGNTLVTPPGLGGSMGSGDHLLSGINTISQSHESNHCNTTMKIMLGFMYEVLHEVVIDVMMIRQRRFSMNPTFLDSPYEP
ncbi:hypothetical protein EVAR_31932_1 [Eumeta japonica]|uniref:Uncharacterized protein n=1 Tax=Eumeta variegata TaxID=151549 RepID=A0A4C1WPF4_EUMVA|nr:hypothetical protein EVAR_31932_1 [Eumeta japonica]